MQLVGLDGSQFCEHIFAFGTFPPMPSEMVKKHFPPGATQSASMLQNLRHEFVVTGARQIAPGAHSFVVLQA